MNRSIYQRIRALSRNSALRYGLITALSLVLLYGVFGYFILPGILQSQAEKFVAEKFHRTLTIEQIEINPYTLLATVRGLKLMEPQDRQVFIGFDSLTVKVSPQSILHLAPVVREVLLSKPTIHLVRRDARHYNFDDILAALASPSTVPADKSAQPATRFSIYNIQLEGGRIEFDDLATGANHVVSDLKLGIPFISSLPSQVEVFVEPLLSAKINGAPLLLTGKARPFAEPKEAALALNLDDVDLTHYLGYLPFEPRFKLSSAKLDIHLNANFRQSSDKAPALLLSGTTALKSLVLAEPDGKHVLSVPQLQVTLGNAEVFGEKFAISHVLLDGMSADLSRDRGGQLNLQRLVQTETQSPVASASTNAASAAGQPTATRDAAAASSMQLVLDQLEIRNASVRYADQQARQPMRAEVEKFELTLDRASLDSAKRKLTIGEISSNKASFLLAMDKSLAAPANAPANPPATGHAVPATGKSAASHKQESAGDGTEYTVSVDKIAIDDWTAHVEDHRLAQAVTTEIGPLKLKVEGLSNTEHALSQIDLQAAVNRSGHLAINGKLGMRPMHGDLNLDVNGVDLLGLQPYVTDQVNLLLTSANLSAKGALKLDQGNDSAWSGGFKGDLKLGNVATVDKLSANDFLRWRSLTFGGVDLKLAPLAVNVEQITLSDFFARVIIDPSGRINLQDISRSGTAGSKSLTNESGTARSTKESTVAQAAPAPTPAAAPSKGGTVPVKIGKLIMQNGKVRYTDNFIKPHYTANLMNLGGSISGLSSDTASRANVDLHGQVNDAPLTIAGTVNPLKADLSLDIKANVKGMELAPLSPYSGRYVGYGIEKGKLSFEVAYQIEQRKLTAQNRLILDQLTFGDKVDSPVATKLPVQFAVALLRDRNGVIDVNLPIGGSLDDPDFSVGGIVFKVIVNIIAKAVTAPFALLGSLFGGGEELSNLAFDSGSAAITPSGESKLKSLATALAERPALKLEITGWSDAESDRSGLQHAALARKVRAIKVQDQVAHGVSESTANVTVTPDEYPALLKRAYQAEKFVKPRNALGFAKDLPVADMENLILANTPISDDDLTALANRRAQAAKNWLATNGNVPAERMFLMASKSAANEAKNEKKVPPARVDFSLR